MENRKWVKIQDKYSKWPFTKFQLLKEKLYSTIIDILLFHLVKSHSKIFFSRFYAKVFGVLYIVT